MTFFAGHVRDATPTDVDAVMAVEKSTPAAAHWKREDYLRAVDGSSPRALMVAVVKTHIEPTHVCGFIMARIVEQDWEIENIVIEGAMQRKGCGHLLLACMIGRARRQNASRVLLEVRAGNHAAIALYKKCGFTQDGVRKGYYSNPTEDAVLFSLSLGNSS